MGCSASGTTDANIILAEILIDNNNIEEDIQIINSHENAMKELEGTIQENQKN